MAGPWPLDGAAETTTSTGTGSLTLAGAKSGFLAISAYLSNGDTFYYTVAHQSAAEREWGIGTYSTTGPSFTRTTVLGSTNSGSAVNFSSGTKDVFCGPLTTMLGNRKPEISITTTATATIDRMHVCSGTSADYTVTLPAASGNTGRLIGFRMATGLTKLVTLDGNASETINGALTRVMMAGDYLELWCDGSNWFIAKEFATPQTGESVLGSSFNLTTTGTAQDTGLSVAIPSAGTYLVTASVRVFLQMTSGAGYVTASLYDATAAATISNSERLVFFSIGTGQNQLTAAFGWRVVTTQAITLKLYAGRYDGGSASFFTSSLGSDSAGRTTLAYQKVAK